MKNLSQNRISGNQRLYVVLTAVWIVIITVVNWDDIKYILKAPKWLPPKTFLASKNANLTTKALLSSSPSEWVYTKEQEEQCFDSYRKARDVLTEFQNGTTTTKTEAIKNAEHVVENNPFDCMNVRFDVEQFKSQTIEYYMSLAFLPPIIWLMGWYATFWIVRGYRPQR